MKKKTLALIVALVMLLVASALSIGVSAYNTGDDYPQYYKNYPIDVIVDEWNFYNRECTSFVCHCINTRNNVQFSNGSINGVSVYNNIDKVEANGYGTRLGHAKFWGTALQSMGYTVDTNPAVGSIAWWGAGDYGHVAWVNSVNGDGTVTIEEYNYAFTGEYNCRTINVSSVDKFIHIKDLDTIEPTIGDSGKVSAVSPSGFTVTFTATDNQKVAEVYAKVWEYGQTYEDARTIPGTLSGSTATVRVDTAKFDNFQGDYYVCLGAKDTAGLYSESELDEKICLYTVNTSEVGTYKAKQDTDVHDAPYEEINGKNTTCYCMQKGTEVAVTGYYTNEWNAKYYQMSNGKWVYADNMRHILKWSDFENLLKNCLNQIIYFFAGQPVSAASKAASTYVVIPATPCATGGPTGVISFIERCTVALDVNGGAPNLESKSVQKGGVFGTLPVPQRFGYRFDGWFTDGGTQVSSSTVCTGDITLYAHWTRIILLDNVKCGDDLYVTLYGDGEMIVTGSGAMTGHPWTTNYAQRVVTVSLPEGMTAFCDYAFDGCTYLQTINIPNVETIPTYCFRGCQYLGGITLPDSVTSIGNYAFANSGLQSLTLPSNLTSIGNYAFANSGLQSLTLPSNLTTLGYLILDGNTGVKSINIPAGLKTSSYDYFSNSGYCGPFGRSAIETAELANGLAYIPAFLFANARQLKSVTIPDSVTEIGQYAFYDTTALESITIPDSVTVIKTGAFAYSGLTSLKLPQYLTTLGDEILYGNTGVKSIVLPNTINELTEPVYWGKPGPFNRSAIETAELQAGSTAVYSYCFNGCEKLTSVTLPSSVTSIGNYAFANSGLQSLTLPSNLTTLGYLILNGNTGVKSINIPAGLTSSYNSNDYGPFGGSAIETAELANGLAYIPACLFAYARQLKSVTIPDSVTEIGQYAFYYTTALESITIPDSVTVIKTGAFAYSGLTSLKGAAGLKTIKDSAFYYSGLESFMIDADLESIGSSVFAGCNNLTEVHINTVPDGMFSGCMSLKTVTIGDTATSIGDLAFSDCMALESITIGNAITTIGNSAFRGCTSLESITIGDAVKTIGSGAFSGCSKLFSVMWSENLLTIGDYGFSGCKSLSSVALPNTVTSIGAYCFSDCENLAGIELSESLQTIGNYAFNQCDALAQIVIPDFVTTLGSYAFYDCDALKSVTLSSALKTIATYTFAHCDSLQSVEIPYRVTSIGNYAFQQDVSLTSVQIPRSVTSIGTEAFNYPDRLTIYGITGTYAETWANANHFRFSGNEIHATSVSVVPAELTIEKGSYANLALNVSPANCTDIVAWKSGNESVVTVDAEGRIYAKSVGTATVRVSVGEDGMGANCTVTVVPVSSSVTLRVSLNYSTRTIEALETCTLKATTSVSSGATVESVTWSSSDESVAKVDENGIVTGYGKGSAVITATAITTGGVTTTANCNVTVTGTAHFAETAADLQSPHNYACDCRDVWVYTHPGAETLTLTFDERTNIEDSFDYLYIYDGTGTQVGKYTGTALASESIIVSGDTVRMKLVSDANGSAWGFAVSEIEPYVFVPVAAKGISFKEDAINLALNAVATLTPVFDPLNTTNQEVAWSTSNKDVVSVSKDGVLCGMNTGTVVITATAEDGGFSASVTVRVSSVSAFGDVSCDGEVDSADAMLVLRACVNLITLTDAQKAAADVNGDGTVDIGDAVLILRYDVGYISSFPIEQK